MEPEEIKRKVIQKLLDDAEQEKGMKQLELQAMAYLVEKGDVKLEIISKERINGEII